jgi:hypothetical protein
MAERITAEVRKARHKVANSSFLEHLIVNCFLSLLLDLSHNIQEPHAAVLPSEGQLQLSS